MDAFHSLVSAKRITSSQEILVKILQTNPSSFFTYLFYFIVEISDMQDRIQVVPLKVQCIKLINELLDGIDDLEQRFLERISYWTLGIQLLNQVCVALYFFLI